LTGVVAVGVRANVAAGAAPKGGQTQAVAKRETKQNGKR
jgi:hypothetical protein